MPKKILLVEDCCAVRTLLTHVLRSHGYTVLEAPDGVAALGIAEHYPGTIDLLLTDLVMPYMPGTVLAQRLRSLYPEIRVLIMTGYTGFSRELSNDWETIDKPFTPKEILNRLDRLWSPTCGPDASIHSAGRFS